MATVASLVANLLLNTAGFESGSRRARKELGSLGGAFKSLKHSLLAWGAGALSLHTLHSGLRELAADERAMTRMTAVLKATGGAAGISAEYLTEYAKRIEETRGTSAAQIFDAAGLLATFKQIKGPTFMAAMESIQDMGILFGSVQSAAIQLGKALNDPVLGVSALQRVGVSFSEQQRAMIKNFQETNQLAKAQRVILDELKGEFGGVAEAAGKDLQGDLDKLARSWENLKKSAAKPLTFVLNVGGALFDFLSKPFQVLERFRAGFREADLMAAADVRHKELDRMLTLSKEELRAIWEQGVARGTGTAATIGAAKRSGDLAESLEGGKPHRMEAGLETARFSLSSLSAAPNRSEALLEHISNTLDRMAVDGGLN